MLRPRSRMIPAALVALLLSGCMTTEVERAARRVPTADLVGLTPAEVWRRLGLAPSNTLIRDGVVDGMLFLQGPNVCPRRHHRTYMSGPGGMPAFEFENGRVVRAGVRTYPAKAIREAPYFEISCHNLNGDGAPDNPLEIALFATIFAPWLAVGLAQDAVEKAKGD